ncbi:thioesterase domain-containing protein [Micromonospora sp. LOL_024]|uniref:thioesterase domain-containing protein n=1 Tax=Micromonospora sp. LOL_024 TaxID=3345412 RepID=UPI003A8C58A9
MLTEAQRAALTARLRQRRPVGAAPPAPVVPFGTHGPAAAFAVHAIGGSVHEYAPLARALDGACAVSGIEAAGLREGTSPVTELATMAVRYADTVRTVQPSGPYRLLGWSMGGVLAYETARRLEADGGEVALVVLVDAPYRAIRSYASSPEGLAALFVSEVLGRASPRPAAAALPSVAQQLADLTARLAPEPAERIALAADLDRRYAVFVAHVAALAGYTPDGPVDAAAVLVTAHGSPDAAPDWRRLFRGGARVSASAADHHGCLRPPAVDGIAAAVRAAL